MSDTHRCPNEDLVDAQFFKTCARNERLALLLLCERNRGVQSKVPQFLKQHISPAQGRGAINQCADTAR
jgi:hypothetical protein